jgi:UDP-glucose 4-epimerase
MRVIITGSSGQIGTNLALRLTRDGHEVFGVDNRENTWTNDFPYLLQDLSGHYPSYPTGIGGVDYPKSDVVVHLAAHAKVHQLVREPHRALENMVMTFNVLEYCRQTKTPIIFSSSREVYGDIHRFDTEETNADFAFTESTYSASKIAGEALVYSYHRCYDLPYIVFRFSNVYGRYDNDIGRMVRVIPLFVQKLSRDMPITIYGEEKVLDFTYVDDCVDGIARGIEALVSGRAQNETINLAYGKGNTLVKMAQLVAQALGKTPDITIAPPLVGEVTHYIANISKATSLLGYTPKVSLETGIPRAVEWQMEWMASPVKPGLPAMPEEHYSAIDQGGGSGLSYKTAPSNRQL